MIKKDLFSRVIKSAFLSLFRMPSELIEDLTSVVFSNR